MEQEGSEVEGEASEAYRTPQVAELPSTLRDPRSRARWNLLSRLFFAWVDPLIWQGWKKSLKHEDLYVHPQETDSATLLQRFNKYWSVEVKRSTHGGKARLWMVIFKFIWFPFIIQGFLLLSEVLVLFAYTRPSPFQGRKCNPYYLVTCYRKSWTFTNSALHLFYYWNHAYRINTHTVHFKLLYCNVCIQVLLLTGQAVTLGYIASYFTLVDPTPQDTTNTYLLSTGLVLMGFGVTVIHGHGFLLGMKLGMICRITCTTAIYQKVLRLSQVTLGKISTGHVVNLTSNDVQRFDFAFLLLNFLWISPLHLALFTYLVYQEVGWPAFPATAFVVLQVPLQILMAHIFGRLRLRSAKFTDRRVCIMNEVITGIRVIKMYAWEYAFKDVVNYLRKQEVLQILKYVVLRATGMAFSDVVASPLVAFLIITPSVLTGGELSLRLAIFILSMSRLVADNTAYFVTRALIFIFDANSSVKRIQSFLELKELDSSVLLNSSPAHSPLPFSVSGEIAKLEGVALSWNREMGQSIVSGVSVSLSEEKPILAIVGPVGAGKSTLLQGLLGELRPVQGSIEVRGQVSYCSQEPWVFSGTLRDNILFGKTFQPDHYQSVLEACALDKDVAQLVHGDLTMVGERGVTLSGGQKARVNLARAVYHQAHLYLLDDPLSAVDTSVARQLYDRVICGLLKGHCVILVTHQLQFAQLADNILAIKNGCVEAYGSYEEIQARGVELMEFIKAHSEEDDQEMFSIHQTDCDEAETNIIEKGNQLTVHGSTETDHFGSVFQRLSNECASLKPASSVVSLHSVLGSSADDKLYGPPPEERGHGTVSLKTYYHYFRAGGGYGWLSAVIFVFILGEITVVSFDWWLSDWGDCSSQNITITDSNRTTQALCSLGVEERVGVYGGLLVSLVIVNIARIIAFFIVCVNASRVLHNRMFASILRAPVHFFDTNPVGRVLNRFSNDTGALDDLLPFHFCEYILLLVRFLAIVATVCASNPWVLIPATLVTVTFLLLRTYYLKTSRELKRLEAVARSPLYSHISATLQGLPTIRSFHQQYDALRTLCRFQNEHSQAFYLYLVTNRWFGIRIDFVSNLFLAAVVFSTVPLAGSLDAGLVGLGLSYTVSLAVMFQFCVRLSTEVENSMISAERVMGYSKLESEASLETKPSHQSPPPHPDWPHEGAISLSDVSFRYSPDLPLVLKNLSFSVEPSEKVGIVGRTGAGKSSIISALFRLAEPFGQIKIDGLDTKEMGLHDLRCHISIIPQDPVLFGGTVRYNLDPFNQYTDNQLRTVLEQVQLKSVVEGLSGGLKAEVTEGGANFSVGQKQLMCLARALLRKNRILVLDEATANVDTRTDGIIQRTLREQFLDCTVLTIAHRLNTIMDYDRILVMGRGEMVEFDRPSRLLQQPHSLFRQMVDKTGDVVAKRLHEIAREADLGRNSEVYETTV